MPKPTDQQWAAIQSVFKQSGVPEYVWYPIGQMESGWNIDSNATSGEDSRGVFQINSAVHPQYDGLDLFDPVVNAAIAARDFIVPAYQKATAQGITDPGAVTEYVWKNGIKPNWSLVQSRGWDKDIRNLSTNVAKSGFPESVSGNLPVTTPVGFPNIFGQNGSFWESIQNDWMDFWNGFDSGLGFLGDVQDQIGDALPDKIPDALNPMKPVTDALDRINPFRPAMFQTIIFTVLGMGLFFLGMYVAFKDQIDPAIKAAVEKSAKAAIV